MMAGRRYIARGRRVVVLAQWRSAPADPEPFLAAPRRRGAPRNIRVRDLDTGAVWTRPARGMRRLP